MKKAIVVTGAAGGMGKALIRMLAEKGYITYAGAIDDWEMDEIERIKSEVAHGENIIPLMLDLREPEHMDALVERIEEDKPDFLCLALVGAICPVAVPFEYMDIDYTTRDVFEGNVFGNLKLIQKCLPTLRRTKGRIVFVSSLFGKTAECMLLSYAASKHAGEAICTVLRRELKPFGIRVTVTNPGLIQRTYMAANHHVHTKALLAEMDNCSEEEVTTKSFDAGKNTKLKQPKLVADKKYRSSYRGFLKMMEVGLGSSILATPELCAKHVMLGIEKPDPRFRYISGIDSKILIFMTRFFPESWCDKVAEIITKG